MSIVRKDWTKEDISKWYNNDVIKEGAKVQYSMDGGQTWLPFQFARQRDEDVNRIVTLAWRGNLIRDIKQEKVKVTNEQAQVLNPTSTFMNSVAKAQARPTPGSRHGQDQVHVYRTDGGAYWFSPVEIRLFQQTQPSAVDVSVVTRTTYYDSITPNTNEVRVVELHPGQQSAALRQLGYVFRLMPAVEDSHISHWWNVLVASNPQFKTEEWLSVRCARHYDESLDATFNNLGQILSVVGGKWIWGWQKRHKLGDTWIFPIHMKDQLVKRMVAAGMAVEPTTNIAPIERNSVLLADNSTAEVTPEYIMGIKDTLEELLRGGDKSAIIEALFKVVEYRNRCVDELQELNKTIAKAKEVVSNG